MVSHGEKKFFLISSFIILLMTTLPYVYGYLRKTPEKIYTGLIECNYQDINLYLTAIKQGEKRMSWENPYTTEPQKPVFIHLFFLSSGKLFAFLHLRPIVVYHIVRIIVGAVFLLVIYSIFSFFIDDPLGRKVAFLLTGFSSGFGAPLLLFGIKKRALIDLWMPELNSFFSAYGFPHFIFSSMLILLVFLFFLKGCEQKKIIKILFCGFFAFILGLVHPYGLVIIYSVLFFYALLSDKFFRPAALPTPKPKPRQVPWRNCGDRRVFIIVLLMSLPAVFYYFYVIFTNPVWLVWFKGNFLRAPSIISYVSAFGLIFIFALYALPEYMEKIDNKKLFILVWIFVILLIVFLPIKSNRKFVQTLQIPLVVLATSGIVKITKRKLGWIICILLVSAITNIFNVCADLRNIHRGRYPYFLSGDIVNSFEWLNSKTEYGSIVLADIELSNFIPVFTSNKVFVGHWDQTIYPDEKIKLCKRFFDGEVSENVLKKYSVSYILCDKSWQVRDKKVYSNDSAAIYKYEVNDSK